MYKAFEDLCKANGVRPIDVCRATGVNQAAISEWKHGHYKPKIDKLAKIARYFNVPLETFVEETA